MNFSILSWSPKLEALVGQYFAVLGPGGDLGALAECVEGAVGTADLDLVFDLDLGDSGLGLVDLEILEIADLVCSVGELGVFEGLKLLFLKFFLNSRNGQDYESKILKIFMKTKRVAQKY